MNILLKLALSLVVASKLLGICYPQALLAEEHHGSDRPLLSLITEKEGEAYVKAQEKKQRKFKVFVINWTPNSPFLAEFKWWLLEGIMGRRYVHTSLVVAELDPARPSLSLSVDDQGRLDVPGSKRFHYFSFPDGNRSRAYIRNSVPHRSILFEAIEIPESVSGVEVDAFFTTLDGLGYLIPPLWRTSEDNEDSVELFRQLVGDNFSSIRSYWRKQGIFDDDAGDVCLRRLKSLLETYGLNPNERQLKASADYIIMMRKLPAMRSSYNVYNNNCAQVVFRSLMQLFGPKRTHLLGNLGTLSPQSLIRGVEKNFSGSKIYRAHWEKGLGKWHVNAEKNFLPRGFRPYWVSGVLGAFFMGIPFIVMSAL